MAFLIVCLSGCSIPLGNGFTLFPFGAPQGVLVTNNLNVVGELTRDGELIGTIGPGKTIRVHLPWDMLSNTIITFKAYVIEKDGRRVYRGQTTRIFYPQNGSNQSQIWTIDYIEPVRGIGG